MHCKSELDNSTVGWKQVALRRNLFFKTVVHSSKSSFGEFSAPIECTARRRLFEWPQFESSIHRPQTQKLEAL